MMKKGLLPFWLGNDASRTINYGNWYSFDQKLIETPKTPSSFLLIAMILFPLASLFLIKVLTPGFYSILGGILRRPKLFIDSFSDTTHANQGLLVILMVFKVLLGAIFLSLGVYCINLWEIWDSIALFKEWGLIHYFYFGEESLWGLFGRSLGVVIGVMMLEYFFLWCMAAIFRIKGFFKGMISLDVMGTFPLIWALPFPLAFALYMEFPGKGVLITILALLILIYLIRKIWISYLGMGRLFSFSTPVKILYICTFNILPYLVWL
jgi:hypothetical protein